MTHNISHPENEEIIQRIGQLARMLRQSMQELGLDREIQKAAEAIPDARDRLTYVASMTEQAANRALSSIEKARPLQDEISEVSGYMELRWQKWIDDGCNPNEAKELAKESCSSFAMIQKNTKSTQNELREIVMAQDFQDLTGQVMKKMDEVIREIEHQLIQVLMENMEGSEEDMAHLKRLAADEWEVDEKSKLLNGPQIKPTAGDAVSSQDQVDDILNQLGF